MATVSQGLEDVIAGPSAICDLNGQTGQLLYRGYTIHDLVAHATFEEVVHLLWFGELPTRTQLEALQAQLAAARPLSPPVLDILRGLPRDAHPMDLLRSIVSLLGIYDPDRGDSSTEANHRKAVRLTSQMSTAVAAIHRLRQGRAPVEPNPTLSTAANFLYMLHGREPDPSEARAMEISYILHADHELNASTFAARVVAATLADMYAAITAALGALSGPLHGGANEQVMRMLQAVGSPERAESYVREALARKQRIMGFGHRVYKTEDPRAAHLRRLAKELTERIGEPHWYTIARRIEEVMLAEKGLHCNVDFYSGQVHYALGIPVELFTPVFACSRIAGWTAHVLEQWANNRLIRPRAEYTGPSQRAWVPLEQR
ncbi:MAG TPA: citrate synthase [Chloroflexota bacterium]